MNWTSFKLILRNIIHRKTYTIVNILGLVLALTCCLLSVLYIQFELSFDRHHTHSERLYRIVHENSGERAFESAITSASTKTLLESVPQIAASARLFSYTWKESAFVVAGETRSYEGRFFLADPSLFQVFDYSFLRGSSGDPFPSANAIILTRSTAQKYFGDSDPLGRTVSVVNIGKMEFTVTGVIEDLPQNSHFQFDLLASIEGGNTLYWRNFTEGWGLGFYNYIRLSPTADPDDVESGLNRLLQERAPYGPASSYRLQPVKNIHLHSHLDSEIEINSSSSTVFLFAIVTFFIMLIACINYINLATAHSSTRATEVGMRKVVGARKSQLMKQFMGESILLALIALPFALVLGELLLPAFNYMVGRDLELFSPRFVTFLFPLLAVVFLVGILAGCYPAMILSSMTPARMLKGSRGSSHSAFRNILVVFQFAVSIAFVFMTLIVRGQIQYILNSDAGYHKDRTIVVPLQDAELRERYGLIKDAWIQNPQIAFVTGSESLPSSIRFRHRIWYEGLPGDQEISMDWNGVDFDFIETYGLELVQGRSFSRGNPRDSKTAYILNESAVKALGWDSPVGRTFGLSNEGLVRPQYEAGEVIGVVRDFHFRSFHEAIEPLVIKIAPERIRNVSVRLKSGEIKPVLQWMKSEWDRINPERPFEYFFFDDHFQRLYESEVRVRTIFRYASYLTLILAALGLFGLAAFKAEKRNREIGIRKVLGASVKDIVLLMTRDIARLALIANLIAWPVAGALMHIWLRDFAYRIRLGPEFFVLSGLVPFFLALAVVGYHALKSAHSSPVQTIKYE